VLISASNGSAYIGAEEIAFAEGTAGATTTTGGTAIYGTQYGPLPAGNAFDGTNAEYASNGAGYPEWIGYAHGAGVAKDIVELRWTPRPGTASSQSPTAFEVQYSPDGVAWTTRWSESGVSGWAAGVTKTFNAP